MLKELGPGFRLMLAMTVLTGLIYPGVMTLAAGAIFPRQANGSLVTRDGQVVGSTLIGQSFTKAQYFHPRPSAAGSGYDGTSSGGSNLGPTSAKLLRGTTKASDKGQDVPDFDGVADRIVHYCVENGIAYDSSEPLTHFEDGQGNLDDVKLIRAFNDPKAPLTFTPKISLPQDAVTGSASGLDPHISPANADLQAQRIAKARGISKEQVQRLIAKTLERPDLGFLGEPRVNVLELNLALDEQFPVRK